MESVTKVMLSLYSVLSIAHSHPSECSYQDKASGVKFNFYALKIQQDQQLNYYKVEDNVPSDASDPYTYTYYFNLCGPVLDFPISTDSTTPNICKNPGDNSNEFYTYCESQYINTDSTPNNCTQPPGNRLQINNYAYAYQLRDDNQMCYPLSSDEEPSTAYSISLYDNIDPTQGITIQYLNGAWSNTCGANRQLRVHLKCEDIASSVPTKSDVTEYAEGTCEYELTVKSIHGCPSGCPAYANSLCASQGLCGYDFSTNRSRCFCYWGYSGSSCALVDPSTEAWKASTPSSPDNYSSDYIETFSTRMTVTNPFSGVVTSKIVSITYDLTDAYNPNSVYQINDSAPAYVGEKGDYRFYFNIGGTINSAKLPMACRKVAMPCEVNNYTYCVKEHITNKSINDPALIGFAFRYTNNTNKNKPDECILLGTKMSIPWDRYDPDDNAAHGIKITYTNGSFAPDAIIYESAPDAIINCKFTINLVCPKTRMDYFEPSDGFITDTSEVTDLGSCHYEASFETAFACPYNCINERAMNDQRSLSVCNKHGMCASDPSAGFARCICDEGYYGDRCASNTETIIQTSSPTTSAPTSSVSSNTNYTMDVVIISALVMVTVFVLICCYIKNKKLKDANNFQTILDVQETVNTATETSGEIIFKQ